MCDERETRERRQSLVYRLLERSVSDGPVNDRHVCLSLWLCKTAALLITLDAQSLESVTVIKNSWKSSRCSFPVNS